MRLHALAFLGGVLLVQQLPALPSLWWGLPALALLPLAHRRRVWLLPLFFLAGVLWISLRAGLVLDDSLPKRLEGQDLLVQGYVADLPKSLERGVGFEFDVAQASLNGQSVTLPAKLRLTVYEPGFAPRIGDEWELRVRLKRPHGFQNPGGFDYEAYLFHERIRATGYVRMEYAPRLLASSAWSYPVGRVRQYVGDSIGAALAGSPMTGMITSFANGDQGAISDAQWEVLRQTGTTHLMAISGMNVGLVAGIAFFLTRWLWAFPGYTVLRLPAHKAGAIAALLAATGYAALAGFAIPTQRALIMLAVVLGALLLSRPLRPSHLLAAALLAVLVYDPLAVMALGFWLSFLSVAVIVFAAHGRLRESKWRVGARIQWVVALGLLPILLLLFQQTSLSAPLANMFAIPVIELLVIPVTLLGVFCALTLPDMGASGLYQAADWIMGYLWQALELLAQIKHAQWGQHAPLAWTVVAASLGVLWLLAPRGFPARWAGAVWLLPLFLLRPPSPAPGEVWFTLLDVDQGLAAVAQTARHTLVFDTGARYSASFDAGSAVVAPYLRHRGVNRLDTLIISHGDNDHIGGAASLLEAFPANRVLSSVAERLPNAQPCLAGETWQWDEVEFQILNPATTNVSGNNASCVLKITSRYGSVLLPADIEAEAERALLERDANLRADILVIPHHGSKTSSTEEFIDAVKPEIALIPAGYRSRYRHPHPTVVARYRQRGIRLLDSPAQGAIHIRLGANGTRVSGYRNTHRRYWYNP
ncbi:MAG: DNA internalization-related competence protein ComEC/Rec2 [Gammaproteobacteria bacterium]|nr:DNA internalization-related competence protein ComEC/Rec2 [Gammaproteobacteria bacterium]